MTRYKTVVLILISVLGCINIQAQKDDEDIYTNFERNYNDLLETYYMQNNEKLLNQRFGGTTYNNNKAASISDEVYEKRLKSIPSAVKLVYNQTVRQHIIYYIDRIGERCGVMLGVSKYYFPIFENILDSYGVPSDLKYMVMIESAFNPKAVSKAGAAGLWQFMYATGRTYDLRVNSIVDDRRDPVLSTIAAAKFLKDLYSIYGDWSLVLAAYNCGPGNVNKAIKRSGNNNFWELYQYLPKETRNYVPAFIAATYVMNFYNEHNIHPVEITRPLDLISDTVVVKQDVYFGQIEKVMGISVAELKDLNPQYKMDYIPGTQAAYSLRLPYKYIEQYIGLEDSIANTDKEKYYPELAKTNVDNDTDVENQTETVYVTKTIFHKVQRGETLSKIARRYGVSVADLRKWNRKIKKNNLKRGTLIAVKQKVAVEKKKYIKQDTQYKQNEFEDNIVNADNEENQQEVISVNTRSDKVSNNKSTTIKNNKNNKNNKNITKETAQKTNAKDKKLSADKKQENQKNNINSKKEVSKKAAKTINHKIKSGETISSIAAKYKVSADKIMKANGLTDKTAHKIQAGKTLKIPAK